MNLLTPLNIPPGKSGDWEIEVKTEPPSVVFRTANMRCAMFGGQKSKKVSWPHETRWHYLKHDGGVVMSDIPCEHAQMASCIKGMKGRVLVGGLGLGLVATLLGNKKPIKEVCVVEKEYDVIKLVQPYLERTRAQCGPIVVRHADLFDWLRGYEGPPFDYAFYDIWSSDGEGTFHSTVCPLYDLSKGKVKHPPVNWNEDVMRGQLLMGLNNRLLFMRPDAIEKFGNVYSGQKGLPPLWENDGTNAPWHNWCVPYWKWWKETQPDTETAAWAAKQYTEIYGRWEWEMLWGLVKKIAPKFSAAPPKLSGV